MSNPIRRKCPQCGKVKLFRADCKTCGCPRPKADPLTGRFFWLAQDGNGVAGAGRIVSSIGSSHYLARFYDLSPKGREGWHERVVSASAMQDWEFPEEDDYAVWLTLRHMELEDRKRDRVRQ